MPARSEKNNRYRRLRRESQRDNPNPKFRILEPAFRGAQAIDDTLHKIRKLDPSHALLLLEQLYIIYSDEPDLFEEIAAVTKAVAHRILKLHQQSHPQYSSAQTEEFLLKAYLPYLQDQKYGTTRDQRDFLKLLIDFYYAESLNRTNNTDERKFCRSKAKLFIAMLYEMQGYLEDKILEKLGNIFERKSNKYGLAKIVWGQMGAPTGHTVPLWHEVEDQFTSILQNHRDSDLQIQPVLLKFPKTTIAFTQEVA